MLLQGPAEFPSAGPFLCRFLSVLEKRKSRLLSWDVVPKIQIHPEYAVAEYCIFSPFSGFFKVQRKIQFVPQITISEPRIIQRVLYNSQIVF